MVEPLPTQNITIDGSLFEGGGQVYLFSSKASNYHLQQYLDYQKQPCFKRPP